jgi:hypothetical protein
MEIEILKGASAYFARENVLPASAKGLPLRTAVWKHMRGNRRVVRASGIRESSHQRGD